MSATSAVIQTNISDFLHEKVPPELPADAHILQAFVVIHKNQEIAQYFDGQASAYRNYACLAIAALVATAAAGLFVAGFFAPLFVPIMGMSICCLGMPAQQLINDKFIEPYRGFKKMAQRIRDIHAEYEAIGKEQCLIHCDHIIFRIREGQYDLYKPLIAAFNYWSRNQENHEKTMREKIDSAKRPGVALDQAVEYYLDAAQARTEALECKVRKAFLLAVTRNPRFAGREEDLFAFNHLNIPADRITNSIHTAYNVNGWALNAILKDFGDKRADAFVVFNNSNIPSISVTEAEEQNEHGIANRIENAMREPPAQTAQAVLAATSQ